MITAISIVGLAWVVWPALRPDPLRPVREALDRRDFTAAVASLNQRLAERPDDPEALLLAARTARRAGDLTVAHERLKLAGRKMGDAADLELERQLLRVEGGDEAEAEAVYSTHIDRPDSPDTPLAAEAYVEGRLRVLAPRSDSQMDATAAEAAGVAKLHRAVDAWLRLRTGKADTVQGLVWRGRIHVYENDHPRGIATLRQALALDPNHFEARWHLAMGVAQDSPAEAAQHLEALLAREPDSYVIRSGLARTYRMLGRRGDSRRILEELRVGRPADVSVLLELVNLALDDDKVEAAGPLLAPLLEAAPNSLPVNLAASRYYQLAGQPAEAERFRKRVEQLRVESQKSREQAPPK